MENVVRTGSSDSTVFRIDSSQMIRRFGDFGLRVANEVELQAAIAVTEALIGGRLAPFDVIARIQARTKLSTWVTGDPVNGFFLFVPLTERGVADVRSGRFVPAETRDDQIVACGEVCSGIYVGVYAGATHEARKRIMTLSAVMRVELFGAVPCFARAATEDGERSMRSLGFVPAYSGMPDLFVHEAISLDEEKAA